MKGSNNEVEAVRNPARITASPSPSAGLPPRAAERHWERLLALYRRNLVP